MHNIVSYFKKDIIPFLVIIALNYLTYRLNIFRKFSIYFKEGMQSLL